jgi:MFS family permease
MARVDSFRMRAGQIFCACDIDGLPVDLESLPRDASIARMALAFGASILAQVLTLSVLPLASASFVPSGGSLPWPYIALLLGAALAGFPASILLDRLGRQSAFALGASLGLAGGILAAFAFVERMFPAFIIGLLWLGMAQGFGLFYRHAGAMAGRAGGLVFGAGAVGALIGPFIIEILSNYFGPLASASILAVSGLAHLITLGLAIGLPGRQIEITLASHEIKRPPNEVLITATFIGALAWLGMNGVMAHAPLAMAGCGLTFSMSALAMAAHLSAMYWPGFTIGHFVLRFGSLPTALIGLVLLVGGGLSLLAQNTLIGFTISMAVAGYGWGMATIGSTAAIHRAGHPSAISLAAHDVILFLGALTGAMLFGRL